MPIHIAELVASWIGNLTAIGCYSSNLSPTTYFNKDQSLLTTDLNWAVVKNTDYSKTCVKWPLKNRQKIILMTNGSLMQVESFAECSPWSILQYFDQH